VPHPRTAGRHRKERLHRHRHRAPVLLTSERGRTVALSTVLSTALVTSVTSGATAASEAETESVPVAASSSWIAAVDEVDDLDARDLAPAKWQPRVVESEPHVTGGISAARVRLKARPALITPPAGVTWVNPNPTARVTSCFGPRWGREHEGVDLAAPNGTPIVAAGAGVVVRAGPAEGYGNAVLIDHGDGWLTHYGHLSVITVLAGQPVAAGQQIGNEGSTGHSTGPHLHFEVHQGFYQNPVEPTRWLREHGVEIPGCAPVPASP
jgi:murein DD-endopeptidase MepM/ murein hydrolase activator NlpD